MRPRADRAAKRAADRFGEKGAIPTDQLLLTTVPHRNPRKARVFFGIEGIGYVALTLGEAEKLGYQLIDASRRDA